VAGVQGVDEALDRGGELAALALAAFVGEQGDGYAQRVRAGVEGALELVALGLREDAGDVMPALRAAQLHAPQGLAALLGVADDLHERRAARAAAMQRRANVAGHQAATA
jgi:hypothetical protein